MPLMRDMTCVSSINSSRSRQRSTAAACSSPIDSSTMAACSTGLRPASTSLSSTLFSSAMFFLYPLFDDFVDALRLFGRQHSQVIDHDVDRRAGRRQVIVFEQGND